LICRSALVDTYPQFPLAPVSGSGAKLVTYDGREYWDFYGGHAVALLGHSHQAVTRAIADQLARLTFYSNVVPLEIRTRAAEQLCRFAGAGLNSVFFCNSGGEANENALKLAIQQTGRKRIAMLQGGWHGRTLLALSATTEEKLRAPFADVLIDSVRLRPNASEDLDKLDRSIAAIIVEPILSIAGIIELRPEYLLALRRRCDETGAYLIYDEVQSGVGRLGRPYVAGAFDVAPDMSTSAKGLANGIPIGAVLMRDSVASQVKVGDLGSTFGGGPVACAAMLAVLAVIEADSLCQHAGHLGELMHRELCVGPVEHVLGRGCLIGLRTRGPAQPVQRRLLDSGFIVGTSADPHVLRLMPPINMPLDAVARLRDALLAL
jgi:acetylornithine/succinyldiaminopimelate/putrescine aminotransferase